MNQHYQFSAPESNIHVYKPPQKITRYYQVCVFKNTRIDKYEVRRFVVNARQEYIDITELQLSDRQCKKLFRSVPSNEYKCFSTNSLDNVEYPSTSDILVAQSVILGTNYDYSGHAPFSI